MPVRTIALLSIFLSASVCPLHGQIKASAGAVAPAENRQSEAQGKLADLQAKLAAARFANDARSAIAITTQIGFLDLALGEYGKAFDVCDGALAEASAEKDAPHESAALICVGGSWLSRGEHKRALVAFQKALTLATSSEDMPDEGAALNGTGLVYLRDGENQKALDCFRQSLPIFRRTFSRDDEADTLLKTGLAYRRLGDPQNALASFNQALPIFREIGDRSDEAADLNDMGLVYSGMGEGERALEYFNQALAMQRQLGESVNAALALNNIAMVYKKLGQLGKSFDYYNQALTIFRQTGDRDDEAGTLMRIGNAYQVLGELSKALSYLGQALAIDRQLGAHNEEARVLNNMGIVFSGLGEPQKSLESYTKAVTAYQRAGDRDGEAKAMSNIGLLYGDLGEPHRAIDSFEQALPIYAAVSDREGEADGLNGIGMAYDELGDFKMAMEFYCRALPIYRQIGDRDGEAGATNNLGDVYRAMKNPQKALDSYNQALGIAREVGDRKGQAIALANIGRVYSDLGDQSRAIDGYTHALPITAAVGDPVLEARVSYDLMNAQSHSYPGLAIYFGKQAVNFLQQVRGNMQGLNAGLQKSFLASKETYYRDLANLLIDQGRLAEAQQVLDLLKQQEYKDFVRGESNPSTDALSLTLAEQNAEQDYEKSTTQVIALSEKWEQLKKVSSRTAEQEQLFQQLSAELTNANQAMNDYYKHLYALFGQGGEANKQVAEVKGNASALRDQVSRMPHMVALYTVVTKKRYSVLVIAGAAMVAREYAISERELNEKVAAFQQVLRNPTKDPRPLARDLYAILVGPVKADLDQAKAKTLVWSLDGVLRYIPMAALYDGKQYLVENYNLAAITPASINHLGDKPPMDHISAVAMGISRQYEGDLQPLPAVEAELDDIVKDPHVDGAKGVLPGSILLNGQFTEKAMESQIGGQHAIVHIASHFVFKPGDDRASYLLLAGKDRDSSGYHLTIADFRDDPNLSLSDTALLTLSACETGVGGNVGDGREVDGLATTAELKGAEAVISSLWEVNDASTGKLMADFYKRWAAKDGAVMKAEALRQAQLDLLRGKIRGKGGADGRGIQMADDQAYTPIGYTHPYYWAPFILMGNWK